MIKSKYSRLITFAAASVLLLAGCGRTVEPEGIGDNGFVNFSVAVSGEATTTKGTMFDSESSLSKISATAWNNDTDNHDAFISGYKEFELTAGKATTDIRWKKPYAKVFYAYANLPATGASVTSSTYEGQTLTYTVPQNAADQNDILMGVYSGNGDTNATASIELDHPLTAVVFKVGTFTNVKNVKSITINDVYTSGSVTQAADGTFAAWSGTTSTQTVKQENASGFSITEDIIGVPFILIPQTNANGLRVEMVLTLTDDSELTCTGTLGGTTSGGVVWEAGKTNTYTVSYDAGIGLNFTTEVTAWVDKTAEAMDMEKVTAPSANEIWYTTSDGQPITLYEGYSRTTEERFGVKLASNTYSNGRGILKFESEILRVNNTNTDQSPFYGNSNLTSITLPESSSITIGPAGFRINASCTIYLPDSYTVSSFSGAPFYFFESDGGIEITVITSKGSSVIKGGCGIDGQYLLLGDGTKMPITTWGCFSKGTLITLADGSRRPVEEIKFGDKLKVWNFDEGHEDVAEILWMIKGERTFPYYFKCTFSDGTTLNVVGQEGAGNHRLFDKTKGSFKHAHTIEPGDEIYTEHGLVTMVSFEKIDEPIEYYNIVTDKHINCFANEVLTSARYNNRWPIDQNMKFVKDGRKIRPYREFKKAGISRQWYDGMRLGEQQDSIARVKAYIDRAECNGELTPYWEEPGFFARIWNWIKSLFVR